MSITLVTFDLDNTLWDVDTVIRNAEAAMRGWLREHVPEVVQLYDDGAIADIRAAVLADMPALRHDLSRFRLEVVKRSIMRIGHGAREADALAARAFDVFYEGRHQVRYFEHALDVLEDLAARYTLAALTNGNADFRRLGLDRFFSFGYSAADVGASKPAPDIFRAALAHAMAEPHQAVHVGDHPVDDIRGASDVGMHTILVNLDGREQVVQTQPTASICSLADLPAEIDRIRRERAR